MIFDKKKLCEFIFVNRRVRYIPLEIFSRICQKTPPNQRKLIHVQSDPLEN